MLSIQEKREVGNMKSVKEKEKRERMGGRERKRVRGWQRIHGKVWMREIDSCVVIAC